jgi:hypothetical protein
VRFVPTTRVADDSVVDEVIAFYLPQFHPIPENDRFWGRGFTEWTNVVAARPLFPGHRQPMLPSDLGYYDLRLPEVRAAQADLARQYGVTAFCYYHYWFAGSEIMQRPLHDVVRSGAPDFPFCVAWANHSWTGAWHGAPDQTLIEQTYPGVEDHRRHFESLVETFADPRYLRVDGFPVFVVVHPSHIPDVEAVIDLWRTLAERAGLGGLFVVGLSRTWGQVPQTQGFDGSVATRVPTGRAVFPRGPRIARYPQIHTSLTSFARDDNFPCVLPRFDNTPRAGRDGLVLHGSSPKLFREHVSLAVAKLRSMPPGRRLLWVKSWNEWAEGNTLEPDQDFGHDYLEALRDGIAEPATAVPTGAAETWLSLDRPRVAAVLSVHARRLAAGDGVLRRGRTHDREAVPVVFSIDCEPDPRIVDPAAPPDFHGYAMVYDYLREWRTHAERVTGKPVRLNWFFRMDHQIEVCYGNASALAERYPEFLDEMHTVGDGVGFHPHAFRWSVADGTWYSAYGNADWLIENLRIGLRAFQDTFGCGPPLLRNGDGILNNELVNEAERAGVRYDLTLEPGRPAVRHPDPGEFSDGLKPDWSRVPREPYVPDREDYRRPLRRGRRDIILFPLTSGSRWLGRSVRGRADAMRANTYRYRNQRDLLYMASPGWHGRDGFHEVLRRSLAAQPRPYLAFAIRTDWQRSRDHRRNIERCLHDLLAIQEQRPLVFCTPEEALALLGSSR